MDFLLDLSLAFVPSAHAALQEVGSANAGVSAMWAAICQVMPFCGLSAATAPGFFAGRVISIVQSLITVTAIIMIIYASIQLSTSQTDESKVGEAKKIIIYALAGIVLALVGGTLIRYLLTVVFPQLFNG